MSNRSNAPWATSARGRAGGRHQSISKKTLYEGPVRHPGHNEFLGKLSKSGAAACAARDDDLVAARRRSRDYQDPSRRRPGQAERRINRLDGRMSTGRTCRRGSVIRAPRLVLDCSIRHAGEGARSSREEIETVAHASAELFGRRRLDVVGPYARRQHVNPRGARRDYDVALTICTPTRA